MKHIHEFRDHGLARGSIQRIEVRVRDAQRALGIMHEHPLDRAAARIGKARVDLPAMVTLEC